MGLLCNIPDIYWRDLPRAQTSLGNPTHFINPELVGETLLSLKTDFSKVRKESATSKVGSLWWRADQFYRIAVESAKKASKVKVPKNVIELQKRDLAYNRHVYQMHVAMGLLGHFVGDVMMPYHNQSDYDGWKSGHGGIHGFYEDTCFDEFGPQLKSDVVVAAKNLENSQTEKKDFLDPKKSVLERMKAASLLSVSEVSEVEKLDQLISVPDSESREPPKRKKASEACTVFYPLVLKQMARSAALLAQLWDQAYIKGNRPQVQLYKSYEYPLIPDFIAPDYLEKAP